MAYSGCGCENGGTCSSSGICICPNGFKGSNCQLDDVSDNIASKTLEIIIVTACVIFFIINGLCWLFIWYKRKQQLEEEGISLDALSRLVSVHANRQGSLDQHAVAMSGVEIPPNYEDFLNQGGFDRSQSTPGGGTPVILPGYLLSHVRHDLKDKRSYSLPNTTIFVPGYYQPSNSTEKGDGDETDSPAFSSPSTPVILPGYMSPVKLSESRSSSPQSSASITNGVLSPLARFWKKTSPVNQSADHSSPCSPVLSVTISPLVTSEVKVDKSQHPSTPTHYNYITTPTKSLGLRKKPNVPKLFIPPHGTSCLVVDECASAPVFSSKSNKKKHKKKVSTKTEETEDSKDTTAMTSLMPDTSAETNSDCKDTCNDELLP